MSSHAHSFSSPSSAMAPYARVKQHLKQDMAAGRWPPGALMPSEAELVRQFAVSRMTINRALKELQAEGLVQRVQGVGTFAAGSGRVSSTFTVRDLHEDIQARGGRPDTQVLVVESVAATKPLAEQMGVAVGSPLFHTVLVHGQDGLPIQYEDRYVNPVFAPAYLEVDFSSITPTHYLLQVAPLWEAQYTIEAALPTKGEAAALKIKPTDPCLVLVRRTMSQGQPVTLARLVHPGQRYQFAGAFKP